MALKAPRHISAIPVEIWAETFEYFAPTPRQGPFTTDVHSDAIREGVTWIAPGGHSLESLSQVCSLFYNLAMRLVRRLMLVTRRYDLQFWSERVARFGKGNLTRRLEIIDVRSGALLPLLQQLPKIQDIYLRNSLSATTAVSHTTDLAEPTYQHLTNLTLSGLSPRDIADVLSRLSTAAKALQRLWIPRARSEDGRSMALMGRYMLPCLEWLIVGSTTRRGWGGDGLGALLRLLTEMFDLPRLRRVDNFDGCQHSFFATFGAALEVVAIASNDFRLASNVDLAAECPQLRTIIIALVSQDGFSKRLILPPTVNRLVLRVPHYPSMQHRQGEEEGLGRLRVALYDIARRRLPSVETIGVSGITDWGRTSGWYCRLVTTLRDQGKQVVETM
ncbi:hypothetical protein DFP72DRAFT_1076899 [Ephemerocybe angulata]|uniref:F-box domain-containing protein n=1 Tax=Ephemerocybe angulata TaxID=980116 RepID=A0A8H6HFK1_9AGAR|nr:hypothetical protein DFP72DRAFT_1076899 [Tulosesus angulatus]